MKDWNMIHKIKALHDQGRGLSINKIATQLAVSRNTVRKYLRMRPEQIGQGMESTERVKKLDAYETYITHLLQTFPGISAQKITQKLEVKLGKLPASVRSIRRYVEKLKAKIPVVQKRYYEPVLDDLPGVQCQIDPGELRGLHVGGETITLYFVVFVLSYSRLMYVSLSFRPINTQVFIQMHDEAFRYFEGMPEECVYDQTKMVVISEEFREVNFNQRLLEYATTTGFRIHACEGYDPESKGKVEAGVKYVKRNCLHGEEFKNRNDLINHVKEWLEITANRRVHATTKQIPLEAYEAKEKKLMASYLSPERLLGGSSYGLEVRQADKTGLISWKGNKYSVPLVYQRCKVGVQQDDVQLCISDLSTGDQITSHHIGREKGRIIKKTQHYKDQQARVQNLECEINKLIGDSSGEQLCTLLKKSNPRIYKDQLLGALKVFKQHAPISDSDLEHVLGRSSLSATRLREFLDTLGRRSELDDANKSEHQQSPDLARYAALTSEKREVLHG